MPIEIGGEVRHISVAPDYLIIGTPSKGGELRVTFDSGDEAEAKKRVEAAMRTREYALQLLLKGVEEAKK